MTVTAINNPVLKIGAQGAFVTELQQLLNIFGAKLIVDGLFGAATEKAVKAFQTRYTLTADGIVNHPTWAALYEFVFSYSAKSMPMLRRGSIGEAVQLLQYQLNVLPNQPKLVVDGDFGPATETAVKALQKQHKLAIDGVVGPKTWVVVPAAPAC